MELWIAHLHLFLFHSSYLPFNKRNDFYEQWYFFGYRTREKWAKSKKKRNAKNREERAAKKKVNKFKTQTAQLKAKKRRQKKASPSKK